MKQVLKVRKDKDETQNGYKMNDVSTIGNVLSNEQRVLEKKLCLDNFNL